MKKCVLFSLLLFFVKAQSQVVETFADGDFTHGLVWMGTATNWQVVPGSDAAAGAAASSTLRLNAASVSGTDYLSTQMLGSWGTQQSWGIWLGRRSQAATASNSSYFWLYASESDVTSAGVSGYRVRFGDDLSSGDKLVLELVANGTITPVLSSAGAVTNGITDYGFLVRVTRDAGGLWTLFSSPLPASSGTGAVATDLPNAASTLVLQGTATNNAINSFDNGFVAVAAQHTTGTQARTGAEFDQILMGFVSASALPLHFGWVRAEPSGAGIRINWNSVDETDIEIYEVERSTGDRAFTPIARIYPLKNDGSTAAYEYFDAWPGGISIYRIKAREKNGHVSYSQLVRVDANKNPGVIEIGTDLSSGQPVLHAQLAQGKYRIAVCGVSGQWLWSTETTHAGGSINCTIGAPHWPPGIYFLVVEGPVSMRKRFVVQ